MISLHALATFLGGEGNAGGKLKETGNIHWQTPNAEATDETGFGALPSGYRNINGTFAEIKQYSPWWSTNEVSPTDAMFWSTAYSGANMFSGSNSKDFGYCVRCLKN
jgi:uncharacterized protein (TIGR02145 family)